MKHIRSIELIGLLAPLFLAQPLAAHWRQRQQGKEHMQSLDRAFQKLAQPAGHGALLLAIAFGIALPLTLHRVRPLELPALVAPVAALEAVRKADIKGPVLNSYGKGGYLIFSGIPAFIDGRADMYREAFLKQYATALELRAPGSLEAVLDKYGITWTLLDAETPAAVLLDRLPGWQRIYADKVTIVHAKTHR